VIKFSIIIPAYNVEDYIFECLSSVASQSVSGNIFEIIVIDDCSDDNTFNIISSYNRVANYSIISNNKNEGLGFSRNTGVKLSKGEYLVFLDADDLLHENALKFLSDCIDKYSSDIVVCNWGYYHDIIKNRNNIKRNNFNMIPYGKKQSIEFCLSLKGVDYTNNHKIMKKSLFEDNKITYSKGFHEDIAVTLKLFYYANKIDSIDDIFYIQRVRCDSITSTFNEEHILGLFCAWNDMLDFALLKDKNNNNNIYKFYLEGVSGIISNMLDKISALNEDNIKLALNDSLIDAIVNNKNIDVVELRESPVKTKKTIRTNKFLDKYVLKR
jgi:glycosyltransferase involved in cell wall biosynthesis